MTEYTDAYSLEIIMKNILFGDPNDQSLRIEIDSDFNQIFHFFDWKFRSIWAWKSEDYEEAYSEASGIMTPQEIHSANKNITTAFKGQDTTEIYISLAPTKYISEVDSYNYNGYRTYFNRIDRGSVVTERNMLN